MSLNDRTMETVASTISSASSSPTSEFAAMSYGKKNNTTNLPQCKFCGHKNPNHSPQKCFKNPDNKQIGHLKHSTTPKGKADQHRLHHQQKGDPYIRVNTLVTPSAYATWKQFASINGHACTALFDTGSGASLISKKDAQYYQLKLEPIRSSENSLKGLFGSEVALAKTEFEFRWNSKCIKMKALVVDRMLPANVLVSFNDVNKLTNFIHCLDQEREMEINSLMVDSTPGEEYSSSEKSKESWKHLIALFKREQDEKIKGPCSVLQASLDTLDDIPIYKHQYPLSAMDQQSINEWLDDSLRQGIVAPTRSDWNHPLLVVRVPCKKPRIVLNPKSLNSKLVTKDIIYPMPEIKDFRDKIKNASWFTRLDLKSAFLQISVQPEHQNKLAFSVKGRGQFKFTRLPFGVASAPAWMQHVVNKVTHQIPGTFSYLDDILIYAETEIDLQSKVTEVVKALTGNNLVINFEKSLFAVRKLKFLGLDIEEKGVSLAEENTIALQSMALPTTVKMLQSTMGAFNFVRHHVKDFAKYAAPFYDMLKLKDGESKKNHSNRRLEWTNELIGKYALLKKQIANAYQLVHPDPNKQKRLSTDASQMAVGGCLEQLESSGNEPQRWKPIGWFSKKLTPSQQNYSTIQKEALAVVLTVENFSSWLMSQSFHLISDHLPLKYILDEKKDNPLLSRWFLRLLPYRFSFSHIKGEDNVLADLLSRSFSSNADYSVKDFLPDVETSPSIAMLARIPSPLVEDPAVWNEIAYKDLEKEAIQFKNLQKTQDQDGYLQLQTLAGPKIYVPKKMRENILKFYHDEMAHLGLKKTYELLSAKYTWPNIGQDTKEWIRTCDHCQRTKKGLPNRQGFLLPIQVHGINERWGCDFVQIGETKLLVMVEYFSKFPVVFVVNNYSSETVINCFSQNFATFGFPSYLTHDQGVSFLSNETQTWLKNHGLLSKPSTPYHPATDGLAERFNRTIIQMLRGCDPKNIIQKISSVLAAYRSAKHSSTNASPYELMFGLPSAPPNQEVLKAIALAQRKQKIGFDSKRVPFEKLQKGDKFLLYDSHKASSTTRKTEYLWKGPYTVESITEHTVSFLLNGKSKMISRHLVVPYHERFTLTSSKGGEEEVKEIVKDQSQSNVKDTEVDDEEDEVMEQRRKQWNKLPTSNLNSISNALPPKFPISSALSKQAKEALSWSDERLPVFFKNVKNMHVDKHWEVDKTCGRLLKSNNVKEMRDQLQVWSNASN